MPSSFSSLKGLLRCWNLVLKKKKKKKKWLLKSCNIKKGKEERKRKALLFDMKKGRAIACPKKQKLTVFKWPIENWLNESHFILKCTITIWKHTQEREKEKRKEREKEKERAQINNFWKTKDDKQSQTIGKEEKRKREVNHYF